MSMSIRIKVDEALPRQVAELFSACGHDAVTVVMQGWQGLADEALWLRVQQEERWLITADKGFADLRVYPRGSHAGVLFFRLDEESRRGYLELTQTALDHLSFEELTGSIIVVTRRGIRIRKP
jgi:predicted nuclease of predicted toxin-antitoxin system